MRVWCGRFMKALHASSCRLTAWEQGFVDGNAQRADFSPQQEKIVIKLNKKYGDQVKLAPLK